MLIRRAALLLLLLSTTLPAADWKPAPGPLATRWTKHVSPENSHPEYPRPQLVRQDWLNLNGLWDYAIQPKVDSSLSQPQGQILVPFPVESSLSGVMRQVGPDNALWYRRTFQIPAAWKGKQIRLHFGAVDWDTIVWVNNKQVGTHRGGYDPFSFDITDALNADQPDQHITLRVWDPSDAGPQPRGKQVQKPHGIWYTPTTGIWQTVWLEPVPTGGVNKLTITPSPDLKSVRVRTTLHQPAGGAHIRYTVSSHGRIIAQSITPAREEALLIIPSPHLWTTDDPFLYDLKVEVDSQTTDTVTSYFALRKSSFGKDSQGVNRLLLNDKPIFHFGPLDQGFWPDGLYTAPTDEALKFDIEQTKKLGFNMIRKHVKVEPARWYYHCDKLGMLVWQDIPSGDAAAKWGATGEHDGTEMKRSPESTAIYETETRAIIAALYNAPSIVVWVPFNEGWGQFDTVRITKLLQQLDPSRLVNCASGGNDFPVGHIYDLHRYPGPIAPKTEPHRVAVLGEYGGLGLPLKGHTWQSEKNWGYKSFKTNEELMNAYLDLLQKLDPLIHNAGLSAAVYTQTTDVEIEVNGLFSYDREVLKMPQEKLTPANQKISRSLSH